MKEQVEGLLEMVRPRLAMHGGNVELVDINETEGIVRVKMLGACDGCPLSQLTLKAGIEALIRSEIPAIQKVEAV
jgi:Fe-S cluster biogenesis protein NfuA